MTLRRRQNRQYWTVFSFAILTAALAWTTYISGQLNTGQPYRGDGLNYFCMAVTQAQFGYTAISCPQSGSKEPPPPSMRREPLSGWLLAPVIWHFDDADLSDCGTSEEKTCQDVRKALGQLLTAINGFLIVSVFVSLYIFTNTPIIAALGAAWAAMNAGQLQAALIMMPETIAAVLVLWFAAFCVLGIRSRGATTIIWLSLAGFSLGFLILTKAVFFYFLIAIIALGFGTLVIKSPARRYGAAMLSVSMIAAVVVAPWVLRNGEVFGAYKVSNRDGNVLSVRAGYAELTWPQYRAGYIYFNPYLLSRNADTGWVSSDLLTPFDRSHPDSVVAKYRRGDHAVGLQKDADQTRLKWASLKVMARNADMTAALIPLFIYRGLFLPTDYALSPDVISETGRVIISAYIQIARLPTLLIVPVFLVISAMALYRRDWLVITFAASAWYSIAIHAGVTHFMPRYNMPLTGLMIVMVMWSLHRWYNARREYP